MSNFDAAIRDWVKDHPYLSQIAEMQKIIAAVIKTNIIEEHRFDNIDASWGHTGWEQIGREIKKGIPILIITEIDEAIKKSASNLLIDVLDVLVASSLPEKIVQYSQQVRARFCDNINLPGVIITEAIENNRVCSAHIPSGIGEGFILFLVWTVLSNILKPLKTQVTELLKHEQWRKGYCPICGQLPAMGQLVRTEKGRERLLVCGCCQMKWQYRRIGCPYCGNTEQHTLKIIGMIEKPDLRIDTCEKCKCYLKTYTSKINEEVALADWSTLHLDLIGKKHGFRRIGYQMYEV